MSAVEKFHCISVRQVANNIQKKKSTMLEVQKQPYRGVPKKKCPENMQQTYRRTPTPKCDFNNVALHTCGGLLLEVNGITMKDTLKKLIMIKVKVVNQMFILNHFLQSDRRGFLEVAEVEEILLIEKHRLVTQPCGIFTKCEHL